jgi:TRAP-type mannitol/chloroaromatic compound transport system permease small subunit
MKPVTALSRLSQVLDLFTEWSGRAVSWLCLLMMALTCVVVVMRYFLEIGSIALQESVTYLHAALFMLAAAYTLKRGGHVRVDIFYTRFSPRTQALVDALGSLLLLIPVCLFILWSSWDYVAGAWAVRETSTESAGLPWIYVLKSLLIIMPITLILQGIAELIKNLLFYFDNGGSHTGETREGML